MNAGALTPVDVEVLESVLDALRPTGSLRFLEIGIYEGNTARGVKEYADAWKMSLEYWGLDNGAICNPKPPFEGAHLVIGDSTQMFYQIPDNLDLVFVDGNHSGNHVILDTLHYGQRVRRGGFMLFHDTSPELQHTLPERNLKEPVPDIPWFSNSVLAAHNLMGFPSAGWELWADRYQPGSKIGGMRAFKKL